MKTHFYKPDGTPGQNISFYDTSDGSAANIKTMVETALNLANSSKYFKESLMKAKEESTFSKLNIDFSKLNKDTTATMTENS